ncbi:hypothetical protein MJT46_017173 [Ovis ammon polii x Ovis aries]|nr:hypothetical protein MJT46_017173 [Ovis ammon polii x Ovis aries]
MRNAAVEGPCGSRMAAYRQEQEVLSKRTVSLEAQMSLALQSQPKEPQLTHDPAQEPHPIGETDPPAQSPSPLHVLDDVLTLRPVAGHPAYPDKMIPSAAEASAFARMSASSPTYSHTVSKS